MRPARTCASTAAHAAGAETSPPSNSAAETPKESAHEMRHHDVTIAHAIDIDVSGISAKRALRHLPVLPGIEMKHGTTKPD
jgi:hypothetical protein